MRMFTEVNKINGVAYTLDIEPENIPVEGNAMCSGNDAEDKKVERAIRRKLRNGDLWAWCAVVCTASRGEYEGRDTLGGCSYRSTKEFVQPGGYWDDMKAEALRALELAESASESTRAADTTADNTPEDYACSE